MAEHTVPSAIIHSLIRCLPAEILKVQRVQSSVQIYARIIANVENMGHFPRVWS